MKKYVWIISLLLLAMMFTVVACHPETPPADTESAPANSTPVTEAAPVESETGNDTIPETLLEEETTPETMPNTTCEHEYGAWEKLDDSLHARYCTKCEARAVAQHLWDDGKADGSAITYTCSICKCTKVENDSSYETVPDPVETIPETQSVETEPPKPFDPVYKANADALIPHFGIDSTQHITSAEKVDNHVHIVPTIGDPYYVPFSQINGARYVAIKYRTDNAEGMALQFYIASTGAGPTDDSTMLRQPIEGDGEWHVAWFDTKPLMDEGLYDGSYVSYFRFDPMDCEYKLNDQGEHYKDENNLWARYEMPEGAYIDIEYIAFFETEEDYKLFENRPAHFVSADYLYENASVSEDLAYNQFMYAAMKDGYITLTGTDTDAYVTAILPGTTDAVTTKYLFIKYRTSHEGLLGQVFTGSGEVWEGDQNKLNFPYEGDGEWHLLMVDLTPNETLTGNAGFLRYDFFQYGADPDTKEERSIDVQYLAFFETAEQAAAFDAAYTVLHPIA